MHERTYPFWPTVSDGERVAAVCWSAGLEARAAVGEGKWPYTQAHAFVVQKIFYSTVYAKILFLN